MQLRQKRAIKAQRVWVASEVVDAFNATEEVGSTMPAKRRAERHAQTIRYLELDEHGNTQAIIDEVFVQIAGVDLFRLATLSKTVEQTSTTFNRLEIEKGLASPTEKVKLQQQQDQIRPLLCADWRELVELCVKISKIAPASSFLSNVCGHH